METLNFIKNRFALDLSQESPFVLPIDKYRGLCGLFNELGFKTGAEIGVRKGMFSKWLVLKVKGLKLYCVDPYTSYDEYSEYKDQNELNSIEQEAHQRLGKLNCEFIKKFSMDAVKDFKDNSLDFVYVDANHAYEFVVEDIAEWSKKVRPGGIVAGHDYTDYLFEVKAGVDGWMKAKKINTWFLTNDKHTSWFYVKD